MTCRSGWLCLTQTRRRPVAPGGARWRPVAPAGLLDAPYAGETGQAAIPVHPDREGTTDDVLLRHAAPVAAVVGVVAVIAHGEVVAFRHHQLTHLQIGRASCRERV